ncbi:Shedu immune nuclease family protein [Nocardia goodfellowii]
MPTADEVDGRPVYFDNWTMARILRLEPNTQGIREHRVDKGVVCEHQVVASADGTPLLHLSTFGSKDRASKKKSSQSLQLDSKVGSELIRVIREAFGAESTPESRIDFDVAYPEGDIAVDPRVLTEIYGRKPELFRALISSDVKAPDLVALAHRRSQVEYFRRLLEDYDFFDAERSEHFPKQGAEALWQDFFEKNPWIFGSSLSGQLLTSWNDTRLEQVVAGHSIAGVGKRTDVLLRTSGRLKSMVFAEIKTHRTELLEPIKESYRAGCWAPSYELSGGVVQIQGTVDRAVRQIAMAIRLQDKAADGSDIPDEFTYLLRPRSYLIIGNLESLRGDGGGYHQDKFRSFELFRRELVEPEIVTFDELLARAEWIVDPSA